MALKFLVLYFRVVNTRFEVLEAVARREEEPIKAQEGVIWLH